MAEDTTLLAYLVPRLTGRVEDTATDALAFILNKSAPSCAALDLLLQDADFNPEPITRVETQVTYQDGSRPDMVGYGRSDAKRLVVESKFWASLQEGQASGYFRQLEAPGPGMLLLIAPESRMDTLWAEIRRQLENGKGGVQLELVQTTERARRAKVLGTEKHLMLVSWDLLLSSLAAADDAQVASDIQQLRGLARYQDEEAFQPIHPEEISLAFPRRIPGLNRLIDDAIGRGGREGWMTTSRLRATPQREGYGRYFRFVDAASGSTTPGDLFLSVNYQRWAISAETPLWIWIGHTVPVGVGKLRDVSPLMAENAGPGTDVAIFLKAGVEYERVLDDVVRQVRTIFEMTDKP